MIFSIFKRGGKKKDKEGSREKQESQVRADVVEEKPSPSYVKTSTVIAFTSSKGGAGKSLLCTGAALIASAAGERVMVVDMDVTNMSTTTIMLWSLGMGNVRLREELYRYLSDANVFSFVKLLRDAPKILTSIEENPRLRITRDLRDYSPLMIRRDHHRLYIPVPGREAVGEPLIYIGDILFVPASPLSIMVVERERFYENIPEELMDSAKASVNVLRRIAAELGVTRVFIDLPPTDRLKQYKGQFKWVNTVAENSDASFLVTEYIGSHQGGIDYSGELVGFYSTFKGFDSIISRKGVGGIIVNKVSLSDIENFNSTWLYQTLSRVFPSISKLGKIYPVVSDPVWARYKQTEKLQIHPILITIRGAGASLANILYSEGLINDISWLS
jgi:hypothetical protein